MRLVLACALAIAATGGAFAQTPKVERIDVTEYGIYTADEGSCARDAQGIKQCTRENLRHAVTTWTVPAQQGAQFGLRFKVVGTPANAKVPVKRIWIFPPAGLNSPAAKEPVKRVVRDDAITIGANDFTTYIFDDPWELVPGPWTLEYWVGDRKVLSKVFTVVKK